MAQVLQEDVLDLGGAVVELIGDLLDDGFVEAAGLVDREWVHVLNYLCVLVLPFLRHGSHRLLSGLPRVLTGHDGADAVVVDRRTLLLGHMEQPLVLEDLLRRRPLLCLKAE